jgi:hypothetical protein
MSKAFATAELSSSEKIEFTQKELAAITVLIRPELNSIQVNGTSGVFTPAPALQSFGLKKNEFEMDLSSIGTITDLRFNHLKASNIEVKFEDQSLILGIEIEDQAKAIQSRLGSISTRNVKFFSKFYWRPTASGQVELALRSSSVVGQLTGSGLLKSKWILAQIKSLALKTLNQAMQNTLNKELIQNQIQSSLIAWSKFYTGKKYKTIDASSLEFFKNDTTSGIRYEVLD